MHYRQLCSVFGWGSRSVLMFVGCDRPLAKSDRNLIKLQIKVASDHVLRGGRAIVVGEWDRIGRGGRAIVVGEWDRVLGWVRAIGF
jgi:hypothetical protein